MKNDTPPKPIAYNDARLVGAFMDKTFNRLLTFHHAVAGAEHTTILFYYDMLGNKFQYTESFFLSLIHKNEMQKIKIANNGLLAPANKRQEEEAA